MSYCPKCGNKIDPAMVFCPNCGASLKTQATTGISQPPYEYRYRHHRHEKEEEKGEKSEKHEKAGGSYIGYLIGGLVVLLIGVLALINATTNFLNGPIVSAIFLVVIGVIIIVAGIYFTTRARQRNPITT